MYLDTTWKCPFELKSARIASESFWEGELFSFIANFSTTGERSIWVSWPISWFKNLKEVFISLFLIQTLPDSDCTVCISSWMCHFPLYEIPAPWSCDKVNETLLCSTTGLAICNWCIRVSARLWLKKQDLRCVDSLLCHLLRDYRNYLLIWVIWWLTIIYRLFISTFNRWRVALYSVAAACCWVCIFLSIVIPCCTVHQILAPTEIVAAKWEFILNESPSMTKGWLTTE